MKKVLIANNSVFIRNVFSICIDFPKDGFYIKNMSQSTYLIFIVNLIICLIILYSMILLLILYMHIICFLWEWYHI